jgi:hypothetical protein
MAYGAMFATLGTSTKAYPDLSRSVYLPYLSLLAPVFSRLDSFCVLYLDALGFLFIEDWSYLALLHHLLRHTFVPRIRYLGFTTRGKMGPLTTTGDLSACKSKRTLIQLLTVNKPLFLAPLPGNTWSRFDLLLPICDFQFSFSFSFCIY